MDISRGMCAMVARVLSARTSTTPMSPCRDLEAELNPEPVSSAARDDAKWYKQDLPLFIKEVGEGQCHQGTRGKEEGANI